MSCRPRAWAASAALASVLALPSFASPAATSAAPPAEDVVRGASPDGRTLEFVRGLRVPVGRGPEGAERTRTWLRERADEFGLDAAHDDFTVERVEAIARGRTRVTLQQTWRGIPVVGARARAVLTREGLLFGVATTFRPVAPDAEAPQLGRERAIAEAARAAGIDLSDVPARARLAIHRRADADRLTWEVAFEPSGSGPLRVWIGAVDGGVLEVDEGVANAVGLAYPTDPREPVAEVTLPRLLPAVGLASRAIGVEDQSGPKVTPLAPDDYRYPPEDPRFDQVNAYWHADRFLNEHLRALGYTGPPESLIVRVHAPLDPDVARTSGRFVHLGVAVPTYTQNAARSHDIIYHEVVHAVLYGKDVQPGGVEREASALHEALADYFTAGYTGDPAIGEWVYLRFPSGGTRVDMPVNPWHRSNFDRVAFGPAGPSSAWANGMILASGLWDLRSAIGVAADSLVLEAMDHLPSVPAWSHLANALLQADAELHEGRFAADIVTAMQRRGIRGAAVAEFSGPAELAPGQVGEFRAAPCCGGTLGRYSWRFQPICRGAPCGEPRELGEGRTLRVSFRGEVSLELCVVTPWGDTLRRSRRVALRPPSLDLSGPTRIAQHTRGTWTARAVASAPSTIAWERVWVRPGQFYRFIGTGSEQTFDVDTSFVLKVTLRDSQNRTVVKEWPVQAFRDKPPPIVSGVFRASLTLDEGARTGEVRYELVRNARLRVEVLDVTGRVCARIADEEQGRGVSVRRFDASGLAPGIYLMRVRHGEDGTVLRFVLLR